MENLRFHSVFTVYFPNRSLLLKGSSGGQRGGPQERLIRLVGRVRRTLGRPGCYSDFQKIFKIRENWNFEYKKWSVYKKENSRFRIRKFCRMLQNCFKKLQNASNCFKILQNASKSFKILQNPSKSFKTLQNLQNPSTCFKIPSNSP